MKGRTIKINEELWNARLVKYVQEHWEYDSAAMRDAASLTRQMEERKVEEYPANTPFPGTFHGQFLTWTTQLTCLRCTYTWRPKDPDRLPKQCARCHSPYWDRPRRKAQRSAEPNEYLGAGA